ncbi:MAG: hypothetical protein JSV66_15220 [Trueperaceae bacterium]|nr:MAG: hypothetical protein JSV66_15220 [Trueperaceae bacterium]
MNRAGVALVTSLIVLVSVTALAGSTLFLIRFQFRIAENARSAVMVRAQVDAGLTSVLVLLHELFVSENSLPEVLTETPTTQGYEYRVVDYQRYTFRSARLAVEAGSGAGRFKGEALIRFDPGAPDALFRTGIVAGGSIAMTGAIRSAANLWAGGTIDLSNLDTHFEDHVTAKAAGADCQVGSISCPTGVESPVVPEVDFEHLRRDVASSARACNRTFSGQDVVLTRLDRETICLEGGATLTVTEGVVDASILGDASTSVRLDGGAAGATTIVSGQVVFGTAEHMSGEVVVVAKQDLMITGDIVSFDDMVRSLFATEGTVQFSGASQFSGVTWSNGGVDLTGLTSYRGAVVTRGAVTAAAAESSMTLSFAAGVANRYLPGSGPPILRLISRR